MMIGHPLLTLPSPGKTVLKLLRLTLMRPPEHPATRFATLKYEDPSDVFRT